jgi:hypothetical protein
MKNTAMIPFNYELRTNNGVFRLKTYPIPLPLSTVKTVEAQETTDYRDLDLREAHVLDVSVTGRGSRYRFDVTMVHDDAGEEGYANWWQVETMDGEQLGRRELLHAHGSTPFTRSETVDVPGDVEYVVIRAHDQTHGYGGQAMVVHLPTGELYAVKQGPDRQNIDYP